MSSETIQFDSRKQWQVEDLAAIDDETHRYEIYGGVLEMSPSATRVHGRVIAMLIRVIEPQLPSDLICLIEFGFGVGDSYREPDFGVVFDGAITSADEVLIPHEDARILVEVMSRTSRARDRFVKAAEYAAAGVPVYLLVDPAERRITVLLLDPESRTYRIDGVYGVGETIELAAPVPLTIPVARIVA